MSLRFTPTGKMNLGNGTIDFDTDTINIGLLLLDGSLTDVGVKAITAASNATPIVATSASHGFANGDIVVIRGVAGNTAANGTWKVANQATNTFELTTVKDGLNSTGNGAYTSGGCVINLTLGDDWADVDGAVQATPVALTTKTVAAGGIIDADDPTFSAWTGTAHAWMIYESGGKNLFFNDGKAQVVMAADAASSATTLWVEPVEVDIPTATPMIFSNGVTATTNGAVTAGARSITVTAISGAIAAGHTADVAGTNSGLPVSATGNGLTIQFSNGTYKIGQY
jgi:hypothetical protein